MNEPHDAKQPKRSSRRGFLLGAGAAGVAGAAATVGAAAAPAAVAQDPAPAAEDAKRGYQLSEHVRRYYRTTRI
jgi:nitrous oxide reductase